MKKLILILICLIPLFGISQRTQLGGPTFDTTKWTVDNPLYYVDTLNSTFYSRPSKKAPWTMVRKVPNTIITVVRDTVRLRDTVKVYIHDTVIVNSYFYKPEQFGALHINKTLGQLGYTQAQINTMYPGIGATPNDQIDWAAWQYAVNKAKADKVGGVTIGYNKYYINRGINLGKDYNLYLNLEGAWAVMYTTNNDSFAVFYRPRPVDNSEANAMVSSVINIKQFEFRLSSKQTAIDLNCLYGGRIEQNWVWNGLEAIHLRFCMGMNMNQNYAQFTKYLGTAEAGDWPGASSSTAQSNACVWDGNHHACVDPEGISYRIYGSSDNSIKNDTVTHRINDAISEQLTAKRFIDFDGKGFGGNFNLYVQNCHLEYNNGFTDCAIKIRTLGGIFVIDGVNYPGPGSVFVDAYSTGGLGSVHIMHTYDYDAPKDGILFRNYGFSWDFWHNEFILGNQNIPAKFKSGANYIVPSACPQPPACGYNRYKITDIPR